MKESQRIQQKIDTVLLEKQQCEQNWQRCAGALQVLRDMLSVAQKEEQAVSDNEPKDESEGENELVAVQANGEAA